MEALEMVQGWASGASNFFVNTVTTVQVEEGSKSLTAGLTAGLVTTGLGSVGQAKIIKLSLATSVPLTGVFFYTYDNLKRKLYWFQDRTDDDAAVTPHVISAFLGITAASYTCYPIQNIVAQRALLENRKGTGIMEACKYIFYKEKLKGFYKWHTIRLMRDVPVACFFFPVYETISRKYYSHSGSHFNPFCGFIFGGVTGGITGAVFTPVISVTGNIIDKKLKWFGRRVEWFEFWTQLGNRRRQKKLYSGLPMRTLTSAIAGATLLGTYEIIYEYLDNLMM